MTRRRAETATLPTRDQLLAFIQENPATVSRRDIARAFNVAPADRRDLTALIRELEDDGLIARGPRRHLRGIAALPEVCVLEITGADEDGFARARPVTWQADVEPPAIRIVPERRGGPAPGRGDRLLARLRRVSDGGYEARTLRRLPRQPRTMLGVLRAGRIEPVDRRLKMEFTVAARDAAGAETGELVLAEPIDGPGYGAARARIAKRLGRADAPGAASLIAIHENAIPHEFAHAALAEAEAAGPAPLAGREDIRAVPLVTIDDEDARDFDDAVWAEPDPEPANRDGFRLLVAIADVAWYVRPGAALDRAAAERGNSVYFPDRVVPMLPEALSNGLCSLKPGEDRPCLAVELAIDTEGKKRRHRVFRAMMRSAARLTYRTVQDARDGIADAATRIPPHVLDPLYGAYRALARARRERGTLDLDLPERRIEMGADGRVKSIAARSRFDSHRLIEEFMILANVAAAEMLEARRAPVMYRVHDEPSREKVEALRAFLEGLGYALAKGEVLMPRHFERVLAKAAGTPHAQVVSEMILRAQAQAAYGPENIGHFGLALRRYCHFTSPIRRYADLLVHRALITALGLGPGGLPAEDNARHFVAAAEHVSMAERRAQKAERDTADRLVAAFLADATGAVFEGRIQGVTRFGLFVHLHESGADGLVPASSLGAERFRLDERRHTLTGERSRRRFALGDPIAVRLEEANALTGGILFALAEGARPSGPRAAGSAPHHGRRGRPGRPSKS